jgi:hypothetical protein
VRQTCELRGGYDWAEGEAVVVVIVTLYRPGFLSWAAALREMERRKANVNLRMGSLRLLKEGSI